MSQSHSLPTAAPEERVSTGIEGLDYILGGGLSANRLFLVQGDPGVGKTTVGLQYLLAGVQRGQPALYVTLSETKDELRAVAESHGWSMEGITVHEPRPLEEASNPDAQYTIFHPSEIELSETTRALVEVVDRIKPTRVVIDSLSELRLLARDPLRYRRQILGLKHALSRCRCTVLILDDQTADSTDLQLQTLAHGVILLEQLSPEFGAERRRLRVAKMRGVKFRGGYHDFTIETGGLAVYPRLIAADYRQDRQDGVASSSVIELDTLLGGGLDRGTSTLLMGAAGAGKSALASIFAAAAAARGEHVAFYTFEEGLRTLFARAQHLGMDLRGPVDAGRIALQQVDPAELSPGEFAHRVREAVHRDQARMVVIDSLNGYLNAMPEEKFLVIQLHELLTFLAHHGVVTILVVSQSGLLGTEIGAPIDISYLADTVLFLRYFESAGVVRKAISVLKKRSGNHERTIRELLLVPGAITVGPPLREFRGVLSGVASYDPAASSNGDH